VTLGYISDEQKMLFLSQQLGVGIASPRQFTAAETSVVALIPSTCAAAATASRLKRRTTPSPSPWRTYSICSFSTRSAISPDSS